MAQQIHLASESRSRQGIASGVVAKCFDYAVFTCLLLTFGLAPHAFKDAAIICTAGTVLFGISLVATRTRFTFHPLFRSVLLFLLLALVSTLFSSAPVWSWRRLAWFSLMLSVIVAGNVVRTRLRAVSLVVVLLLSSSAIIVRTGWQYTHGIGARLAGVPVANELHAKLLPDDIIQTVNGHPTRSPKKFEDAVRASSSPKLVFGVARGAPIERVMVEVNRSELDAAMRSPGFHIERGHPIRAQAGFYHYVPFAGYMCVIALLAWGLVLTTRSYFIRAAWLLVSVGATAAVAATLTRTYLVALIVGALAALWVVASRKQRLVALICGAAALLIFTFVLRHERGVGWVAPNDPGTQYRLEMWRDGMTLIHQHPLLGIGLDATLSGKWDLPAYRMFPLVGHFHSSPIQMAVDVGLPALIAWLWIAVSLFSLLFRSLRRVPNEDRLLRGVVLGVFGTTVAFYAASLVHYNQGDAEVMILMYVLMGTAVGVERIVARANRRLPDERLVEHDTPPLPIAKAV